MIPLVLLTILLIAMPAGAQGLDMRVVKQSGTLWINGKAVGVGTALHQGDILATASASHTVVALWDGSLFRLAPNSRLSIPLLGGKTRLSLTQGGVLSLIQPGLDFGVATPHSAVTAQGAVFYLAASSPTYVCLCHGTAKLVSTGGKGRQKTVTARKHQAYLLGPSWKRARMVGHTDREVSELKSYPEP